MVMRVKKAMFQGMGVHVSHTHMNKETKEKKMLCHRAEFTGHNSVLFVIALILAALSSKCAAVVWYCVHHIVVSLGTLIMSLFELLLYLPLCY